MPNARFLFDDKWRTATNLSATSTDTNTALAYTQNHYSSRVWRSTGLAAQTITADLTNVEADCLVIAGHNFTASSTVAITTKLATVTVDTFNMTLNGTSLIVAWFTAAEIDELQIVITDASNPDGYMQIGQIMVGGKFELSINADKKTAIRKIDNYTHTLTASGTPRTVGAGESKRMMTVYPAFLTESDRSYFMTLLDSTKKNLPVLVSLNPESGGAIESQHQMIGKRMNEFGYSGQTPGHIYNHEGIEFREV